MTLYFFDVKDLIYTLYKEHEQLLFKQHFLELPEFFPLKCCLKPLGPRLHKLLTLNGTFSSCKVVWSLSDNIA